GRHLHAATSRRHPGQPGPPGPTCWMRAAPQRDTFDDVALYDIPAAVTHIKNHIGQQPLSVVAHCMGALILSMSLTAGLVTGLAGVDITGSDGLYVGDSPQVPGLDVACPPGLVGNPDRPARGGAGPCRKHPAREGWQRLVRLLRPGRPRSGLR